MYVGLGTVWEFSAFFQIWFIWKFSQIGIGEMSVRSGIQT